MEKAQEITPQQIKKGSKIAEGTKKSIKRRKWKEKWFVFWIKRANNKTEADNW